MPTRPRFGGKCEACGQGTVRPTVFRDFVTAFERIPFVVPEAVIGVCDACGEQGFSLAEYERWQALFRRWLDEQQQVMPPAGIRALREQLGMNKSDFAALLGVTRQALHYWEKDDREVPQSRSVDLMLRLLRESLDKGAVDVPRFLLAVAGAQGVRVGRVSLPEKAPPAVVAA
jgi:putative zinc finger/helix-turn-helix YgiT family protein